MPDMYEPLGAPPPLVLLAAVLLAFSAQTLINSMLGGDRGLGAFLSDGTGFNRSGFKPRGRPAGDGSGDVDPSRPLGGPDPLPWLKLPELDYVEVAGQKKRTKSALRPARETPPIGDADVVSKLESLREKMKAEAERGNLEDAKETERDLERLMKEEGFDYFG